MLRHLAILALLPLPLFVACGDDDDATPGTGGSAGEGGAGGGCEPGGTGKVTVTVTGLPSGVAAAVTLTGPDGSDLATGTVTYDDLGTGTYSATARRVTDDDPIVRTLFVPTVTSSAFCLEDGGLHTVTVSYTAIPSSNKLWTTGGDPDALTGFASAVLDATGDPDATVAVDGPAGGDVAFDRDGNLWSTGSTSAVSLLLRFPVSALGVSGESDPDRSIDIAGLCIPAIRAIAFDPSGNLWVSACGDELLRLSAASLAGSGTVTPSAVLSAPLVNEDIAFDSDGNLWMTGDGMLARIDADHLTSSTTDADLTLTVTDPDTMNPLGPTDLAFDTGGNLWFVDFGANAVAKVAASELDATGDATVVADVRVSIGVLGLLNRPAFDEGGGLWLSLSQGSFGRLSPEQLTVSTEAGDPTNPETIISSADTGYADDIAFFPAPAGLPLYHSEP